MGSSSCRAAAKAYFNSVLMSSSDEDTDGETELLLAAAGMVNEHFLMPPRRGGSSKKREGKVDRDQEANHVRLYNDYFDPIMSIYKAKEFCRRYRMSRELFLIITNGVRDYDDYFKAKYDCIGKIVFSSYQKCSAAVRQLAYGVPGDLIDDYIRMNKSTCHEAMYRFWEDVTAVLGEYYLRVPNMDGTAHLLSINESRGFLGMLGSIDCIHWQWKNCPFGWQGQFKGLKEGCTVILEAVASHDFLIWHSFFGMTGSNNDINVLHRSPVISRHNDCTGPQISYEINGNPYDKGYYLAGGIYPSWPTLVKTVHNLADEKYKRFAKEQEAARKDVERTFGVL
jgi:hypothetical protein